MTDAATILLTKLLAAVENLHGEAKQLRLEVLKIGDRVESFDDEDERFQSLIRQAGVVRRPRNAVEALQLIGEACHAIQDCEIDTGAIRARLDQIANNPKERQRFAREGIRNPQLAEAEKAFKELTEHPAGEGRGT